MAGAPIETSQKTTFKFGTITFRATGVKVNGSVNETDVSTLDLDEGSMRVYQVSPLVDGDTVSCSFYGVERPDQTGPQTIECEKFNITGKAICTKFTNEAKVGEMITGDAEFRLMGAG
jgi:hypothetical protein